MYNWQAGLECGTCTMVLRHILAVIFSITFILTDGYAEKDPLQGLYARQIWIFTCEDA
jgi:hypothetical protein